MNFKKNKNRKGKIMMNEEQRQQIVLDAIKECANVSDPVQYARLNYRVYEVAMKAVEMATSNDAKQNLIKKQMRDRYEFVKKQYNPIYAGTARFSSTATALTNY